ncbi:hypothetical protein [Methanolobus psychrotolerans]|uniref:hypothetical protein n=1 Tax=Methanolobus psychrotolerans TaxID=1874706 RepID=UPI000B91B839|nr:hypothetical protein [Methanolobus psychrotolerans]
MEDSDVLEVIFDTIEPSNLKSTIFNGKLYEYVYNPGNFGISEMTVWINKETGKVVTAFPNKGTDVWKWTGVTWKKVI